MPEAVRCVDVYKTFRQGDVEIKAVDHVDLQVDEGEFVCLSAPSGGGKTTLLNVIGGLLDIDGGEVWVAGRRIDDLSKGARARMRLHQVGFVFQAYNLIPVLSARENVEFVMEVQGVPAARRRERAMEILAAVGLAGLEDRRPAQMSGGQQQRVTVGRAIAAEPALVLADEPTANLDSKTTERLLELLVELNTKRKTTFVMATHDERVMQYARRIVRMLDGRIVADEETGAAR